MQRYSYKSVSHTKWHVFFVLLKLIVNNTQKGPQLTILIQENQESKHTKKTLTHF